MDHLRRYPDPESRALREAIAREVGVEPEQVFVGNGSDEVLALAFQAFFCHDRPLEMPDITYSFYPVYCRLYGVTRHALPLDEQWRVDLELSPRNPAASCLPIPMRPPAMHERQAIATLLSRVTDSVVLIDEAYADFGGESAIPLVSDHPNLLVTGTFSKSRSLAGLRLGYAVGSRELIEGLERVKDSFNSYPIDSLASAVGIAALADHDHFEACREAVITTRERTRGRLEELGFRVLPSRTNFLLVHHPDIDAAQLFVGLRERGILVRHFNTDALRDYLRISIGTEDEMDSLVEALEPLCT